jgi:hypothetical protein
MKFVASTLAAGLLFTMPASAAVLFYNLTATGDNGTTGTGTFSFDDTVVGAEYDNFNADADMSSFTVTLNVSGGTPSVTIFDLSTVSGSSFVLSRSGGVITDFNPGGVNPDGYSLNPFDFNMASLSGNTVSESISWSYSPVPEPQTYAAVAGLGLFGFAVARRVRRSVSASSRSRV